MVRTANTEMPNLFIIGAAKCGTTSLHFYLGLHPEISMSSVKEPKYFLGPLPSEPGRPRVTTREEYLGLFAPGTPIRGEASVAYSISPFYPGVPERIGREVSDARFIYMVRDPIERIISGTKALIGEGRMAPPSRSDEQSFWEDVIGELDPVESRVIARSMYMAQLEAYLEHFPTESIMVIDQRELLANRIPTLVKVFSFVGVDPSFRHPRFEVERNSASVVTSGRVNQMLRTSGAARRVSMIFPERTRKQLMTVIRGLTGGEIVLPEMRPELRQRLVSIFSPDVTALRNFTGQEFSDWSI